MKHTNLSQLHLQVVLVLILCVEMRDFFGWGFYLEDDHDIREDDDAGGEDEAEEEHAHNKALARYRSLGQPPVQRAGGAEWLRCIVAPAYHWHGGPEGSVDPRENQSEKGMTPFEPCTWWPSKFMLVRMMDRTRDRQTKQNKTTDTERQTNR